MAAYFSFSGPVPSCPATEAHPGVSSQAGGHGFLFACSTSDEDEHVSQRHTDTFRGQCTAMTVAMQTRQCLQQHPHTGLRFNKI